MLRIAQETCLKQIKGTWEIFRRRKDTLLNQQPKIETNGALRWRSAHLAICGPKIGALRTTTGALMRMSSGALRFGEIRPGWNSTFQRRLRKKQ